MNVNNRDDCRKLQCDIYTVAVWCERNGMTFNVNKCKVLRIYCSSIPYVHNYNINDVLFETVENLKDLAIIYNDCHNYVIQKTRKRYGNQSQKNFEAY